jgi:hypothetical protein
VGANVIAILNHPNWLANDAVSSFIGVVTPGATTINGGLQFPNHVLCSTDSFPARREST